MSKKEIAKRYILFITGLFFSALGIAFTKHAALGISPISSVANVLSCKFTFFTMGTWLIIWNCVLILGQILILRRKFKPIELLQIPLSFLFGWFTDLGLLILSGIPADTYFIRFLLLVIGIIILGFGISLAVIANVILNSGEAFVKAVSDTVNKDFGNVKTAFDISCVTAAIILSLALFNFNIVGIREGTVISAVFTGFVVKFFVKILKNPIEKVLTLKK